MIEAVWVSNSNLHKIWDSVEPLLKNAIMKWLPVWDTSDFYSEIQSGTKQLWIAVDKDKEVLLGAVVTEVIVYPKAKMTRVVLLGGNNIKSWKDIMGSAIETFARSEKCLYLDAQGRRGWQALFLDMFKSGECLTKVLY